ncbi:hypothetical protein OBBRIDRAFT_300411 [Obba rivulosa]|uniref:Uncharacterized protein n=1 Tax=Obba rivulosa TaxID=1052685 RepID=A0A8E2DF39_9APHY|nr:hypothetical protein OBBRIDRAFT_300411 [Obba rivulosa]
MSIRTSQFFDVPRLEEDGHGYYDYDPPCSGDAAAERSPNARRRFFQSAARWDSREQVVTASRIHRRAGSVAETMAAGGGSVDQLSPAEETDMGVDEEDEEDEEEEAED